MSIVLPAQIQRTVESQAFRYGSALVVFAGTFYLAASVGAVFRTPIQTTTATDTPIITSQAPNQALVQTESSSISEGRNESSASNTHSIHVDTNSAATEDVSGSSVKINGQEVPLKRDGEVHKVVNTKANKTTVDISMKSNSSSSNNSSLDVSVQSSNETFTGN